MKKSIALVALAFGVSSAFAQDLTSKKGEPILPEAGDWAIGLDATPFLNYAGNFFGKQNANVAPTWDNYGLQQTIVGKYFKDANMAYRGILRIGLGSHSYKADIAQPQASSATPVSYPNASPTVEDKLKRGNTFIGLGAGIEKRKGKTRLQGFYGADAFIWYSGSKDKYTYGNALTEGASADPNVDPVANSTNWSGTTGYSNTGNAIANYNGVSGFRIKTYNPGGQVGVGVRAFIGAEYFILPKISIGGEFGWGIGYAANLKSKIVYETEGVPNGGTEAKNDITVTQKRGGQFILDTDRNAANSPSYNLAPSGTLRLNLHF